MSLQNSRSYNFIFVNLINFVLALVLRFVVILAGRLLAKKTTLDRGLISSFECGFDTSDRGLLPFSLRFYLLANIFLIFDVELILLFPFLTKIIWSRFWVSLIIFRVLILFLSLGLFHEWNQKILEWVC